MTTQLPNIEKFVGSEITEGQFKEAFTDLHAVIEEHSSDIISLTEKIEEGGGQ